MKTFLIFSLLSFNAIATCPQFGLLYSNCSSASGNRIDSVLTKSRHPYYSFIFRSGEVRSRYTIVTDGEPRDITIQTQDGSESYYSERAYCEDGKLSIIRLKEDTQETEKRVFEAGQDYLKIYHTQNGSLKDVITCHL